MKREIKNNVLLFLGTLVVAFIIVEIALRFVLVPASWPREQVQASDNEIISYELKPNLEVIERGPIIKLKPVGVRTNSRGLREDEEHAFVKDDDTYRIAIVGDSLTFGMYIGQNETYAHRLESLLNENSNDQQFQTLNFGVPGYNTNQELEVVKDKVLAYDPDMVILLFSPNDFTNVSEDQVLSRFRQVGSHIYSLRLGYWVWFRHIRGTSEYAGISEEQWDYVRFPLKEMARIAESNDITFVVMSMYFGEPDQFYIDYSSGLSELSRENGFTYFDMQPAFSDTSAAQLVIPKEGHPSALANKILAENLYKQLQNNGLIT